MQVFGQAVQRFLGQLDIPRFEALPVPILLFKLTSCGSQLAAGDARKAQKLLTAMLTGKGVGPVARKQILETPLGVPVPDKAMHDQQFWEVFVKQFHCRNFMTLAAALNELFAYHSFREMCIGNHILYCAIPI